MQDKGVFLRSHREGTGVRCGGSWTLLIRRRAGERKAGLCILEGDSAKPGSEGRLHHIPDLSEVTKVGGGCRGSVRAAHAGPGRHRGVRA